jgi:CBS-domain-containing membrane protein
LVPTLREFLLRLRAPPRSTAQPVSFAQALWSGASATLGLLGIHALTVASGQPLLIGSLGASAVLLFAAPEAPLSQPRNLVGGHVISALVAACTVAALGSTPYTIALAVGLAIFAMMLTRTLHPPGGATALIGVQGACGFSFVLVPVLASALVLLATALVTNNLGRQRRYPTHWL